MFRPAFGRAIVVSVVLNALNAAGAGAAVDATGRWHLTFEFTDSVRIVDFDQVAGTLTGRDPSTTAVVYDGTIDASTGAFDLAGGLPGSCGPAGFHGTVAADSQSLDGVQQYGVLSFPGSCNIIDLQASGARVAVGCGDGVVEGDEACDDANTDAGDGCAPDCTVEECWSCGGSPSTCNAVPCGPCEGPPRTGCRGGASASPISLQLRKGETADRNQMSWKWSKGAAMPGDFGDPTATTSYAFCLFDVSGAMPTRVLRANIAAAGSCDGEPCWKAAGTQGYGYSDREAASGGINRIKLRSSGGRGSVQIKAGGANLSLPDLPLAEPVALIAQLQSSDDVCWEAGYSAAGVDTNDSERLRARASGD